MVSEIRLNPFVVEVYTDCGGVEVLLYSKGTLLGTPNREPQEYSRYRIGIYLPGSLYSIISLLYSWGSLFRVPSRVPLYSTCASVHPRDLEQTEKMGIF